MGRFLDAPEAQENGDIKEVPAVQSDQWNKEFSRNNFPHNHQYSPDFVTATFIARLLQFHAIFSSFSLARVFFFHFHSAILGMG